MDFYELGDGYKASELFPIGSKWRVLIDMPGVQRGEIVTGTAARAGVDAVGGGMGEVAP